MHSSVDIKALLGGELCAILPMLLIVTMSRSEQFLHEAVCIVVLQQDLNAFVELWNSHRIRTQNAVSGRPFVLYWTPQHSGHEANNYYRPVDNIRIQICLRECETSTSTCQDEDVFNLACMYMQEDGLSWPNNAYDAANLYTVLRDKFHNDL